MTLTHRPMIPADATRKDVVALYRKCLLTHSPRWSGWGRLNQEIIERSSVQALHAIKREAWK
jgi:hypothetical protein